MKTKLNIILPIYNPHEGWEQELIEYFSEFSARVAELVDCHLIMVNDGSKKDISSAITTIKNKFPNSLYIHNKDNKGKGHAIRTGAHYALEDLVMFTDYDFPYEVDSMVEMLTMYIENTHSICIAKRDESYYTQAEGSRNIISKTLKAMNKTMMRLPVIDTQGGLKLFNQQVAEILRHTTTNRYLIDIELLKSAHKAKIDITSVNVKLRDGIQLSSTSNMRLFNELQSYFKILFS